MSTLRIKKKVALFDLDGVVFDTEPLYTEFWKGIFERFLPGNNQLEYAIKGQTLVEIYDKYFPNQVDKQQSITQALNDFEQQMPFNYVAGFLPFIEDLKRNDIKTAVVTSSNREKMKQVYKQHPDFKTLFNKILTSEDFNKSKPDPDCYLKGTKYLEAEVSECIGFEDSLNGLRALRAAHITTIGLSTTNSPELIASYADIVIPNYQELTFSSLLAVLDKQHI